MGRQSGCSSAERERGNAGKARRERGKVSVRRSNDNGRGRGGDKSVPYHGPGQRLGRMKPVDRALAVPAVRTKEREALDPPQ